MSSEKTYNLSHVCISCISNANYKRSLIRLRRPRQSSTRISFNGHHAQVIGLESRAMRMQLPKLISLLMVLAAAVFEVNSSQMFMA